MMIDLAELKVETYSAVISEQHLSGGQIKGAVIDKFDCTQKIGILLGPREM